MGSLKKQIQAALKLHSAKIYFHDIETRYKNDSIIFVSQKKVKLDIWDIRLFLVNLRSLGLNWECIFLAVSDKK